jgi:hypothetical protein
VLFGAAVDPALGDSLSLTLISALPEDSLAMAPRESLSQASRESPLLDPSQGFTPTTAKKTPAFEPAPLPEFVEALEPEAQAAPEPEPALPFETPPPAKPAEPPAPSLISKFRRSLASSAAASATPALFDDERPFAEPELVAEAPPESELEAFDLPDDLPESPLDSEEQSDDIPVEQEEITAVVVAEFIAMEREEAPEIYLEAEPDPGPIENDEEFNMPDLESSGFTPIPRKRPIGVSPWSAAKGPKNPAPEQETSEPEPPAPPSEPEAPKLKLGIKPAGPQSELSLDSAPRGRFEGETPNVFEGEDLDLPPFLRKKK